MIEARDPVKEYPGNVRALDGLSFAVEKGVIFGLLGPNGAGKSTALCGTQRRLDIAMELIHRPPAPWPRSPGARRPATGGAHRRQQLRRAARDAAFTGVYAAGIVAGMDSGRVPVQPGSLGALCFAPSIGQRCGATCVGKLGAVGAAGSGVRVTCHAGLSGVSAIVVEVWRGDATSRFDVTAWRTGSTF